MTCQCLKLDQGEVSNGGRDYFYIDKASNLYLNYDFAKTGIEAEFGKNDDDVEHATITGRDNTSLNTYVEDTGGVRSIS